MEPASPGLAVYEVNHYLTSSKSIISERNVLPEAEQGQEALVGNLKKSAQVKNEH